MAYDEELALRLQLLLADEDGLTTKKMFGGLGWVDEALTWVRGLPPQ